jgi:parallel beta-helix repeat protein
MKNLLKAFSLFIVLFLFTMCANARRFYVSSSYTGSTSNGALATPWKSLANVQSNMSTFTAGDTISFKCGDTFTGTLTITKSGSASNPIVFNTYDVGAKPMLTGTGVAIDYLIQSNNSYLVVDGFQIIDPALTDTGRSEIAHIRRAITFRGAYCVAKNNEISRAGIGIYISTGTYATIDNNTIHHLKMIVNDIPNPDNDYGGAPIWLAGNNNTVTNNTCYSNWAISYDYGTDGGGFEFYDEGIGAKNNFMAYNTMYENNGLCETSYLGACDSNTFAYNKFINNGNVVYLQDSCFGWKFYNNVIVENLALQGAVTAPLFSGRGGYMSQIELRNNIFQKSTSLSIVNTARFFSFTHTNNIYKLSGSASLGFTLGTAEMSTSATIWTDTVGLPQVWDYHLVSGSPAINAGINVGLTRDFGNNTVSNPPDAGIYEYTSNPCSSYTYSAWSSCVNSVQTRIATGAPSDCIGTPPADSLSRTCSNPCTSWTYGAWTTCSGNKQTRVATGSPSGCTGTPDSALSRDCSTSALYLAVIINRQASCNNKSDGYIVVKATGGVGPYYYSINSTTNYILNKTSFNVLRVGTYTIRVRDSIGTIYTITVKVTSKRNRNC